MQRIKEMDFVVRPDICQCLFASLANSVYIVLVMIVTKGMAERDHHMVADPANKDLYNQLLTE